MSRKRKRQSENTHIVPADVIDSLPTLTHVDSLTSDGQHIKRRTHLAYAPQARRHREVDAPLPDPNMLANDTWGPELQAQVDAAVNGEDTGPTHVQIEGTEARRFATLVHDQVLLDWATERQQYVHEALRHDGRADAPELCPGCPSKKKEAGVVRCDDCFDTRLFCRRCCISKHTTQPFHRVQSWTGQYFKRVTLQDLGLVIQLGHHPGDACRAPYPGQSSFLVIHVNGFHPLSVQFCQCSHSEQAGSRSQQLLRARLYPATSAEPTTCVTFEAMDHYHTMTLQSKMSSYDYYKTLEKLTDNTGLGIRYDRLKAFLRVVRQWRNILALKRSGRGHELSGVRGTQKADLSVRCPACPRIGYNLPENWESMSDDLKFLYILFIAIDANFRLKRRAISNETRDPSLGSGWGYFVEDTEYRSYLKSTAAQQDIRTCAGFAALMNANNKYSKGYATTGVAMCVCARHGFVLPNAVGDLQKGERFANIDYVFCSTYKQTSGGVPTVVSYDIACQWMPHLVDRIKALPEHIRVELPEGEVRYAIPKYHFAGHKKKDHSRFSLNYLKGVGRTDGEQIERGWSDFDEVAGCTREMGPGSRHDTLEDHFGWSNWQKLVGLGRLMQRRLAAAIKDRAKYAQLFADFKQDLQSSNVDEWTAAIVEWEANTQLSDPYDIASSGPTEVEIRAQLAAEEEKEASKSSATPFLDSVTPSALVATLLDLEDQQRKIKAQLQSGGTPKDTEDIAARRTSVRRRLAAIRPVQVIYMPPVEEMLEAYERDTENESIENVPLFLPSSLAIGDRSKCSSGLANIEARLREGQLRSALDGVRLYLHMKSRLVKFKHRNVRHQGAQTRARTKIDSNQEKIILSADKYRAAWAAMAKLAPRQGWDTEWRILQRTDVRCLDEDDGTVVSEGRRAISWIWQSADMDEHGSQLIEALRVEFFKARARSLRFAEEVQLLQEEQRRILVSLENEALTWERRARLAQQKECPILRSGAIAYAVKQQELYRGLQAHFRKLWTRLGTTVVNQDPGGELDNGDLLYRIDDESDDEKGPVSNVNNDSDDDN